ncbi:MAG: hypothetical protein AAF194_07330 [Pseudomonadota bacterium]
MADTAKLLVYAVRFEVTYRSPGKEDLFMRGIHRAEFIGERIHKLAVRILP